MADGSVRRLGGGAAVLGGVLALVGNLLHPRYANTSDVARFSQIATSNRYAVADALLVFALIGVVVGVYSIAAVVREDSDSAAARLGGVVAAVGGAMAISQFAVEEYGLRQSARTFVSATRLDQRAAFFAAVGVDKLNSALFAGWTIVLLGVAPLLIGIAILRANRLPNWQGGIAVLGGGICAVAGTVDLLKADQSSMDLVFLVGSLLVTAWVIAGGVSLWREAASTKPMTRQ